MQRAVTQEETLAILVGAMHKWGVTRLANITGMDIIGVPVWQAIRPSSKNLCVSQGKGLTPTRAKNSALMESLEMHLAENPPCHIRECEGKLDLEYDVLALPNAVNARLMKGFETEWVRAENIVSGKSSWLPRDLMALDFTNSRIGIQTFQPTSSGLAGGNSKVEAILQGLTECIERDSTNAAVCRVRNANDWSVFGDAFMDIAEVLLALDIEVEVEELWGQTSLPTIRVAIGAEKNSIIHEGTSCRVDPAEAALPALLEAIQSRLTDIAAVRDDVIFESSEGVLGKYLLAYGKYRPFRWNDYQGTKPLSCENKETLEKQLSRLVDRLIGDGFTNILAVDLSRPDLCSLPVFFVSIPGLKGHF